MGFSPKPAHQPSEADRVLGGKKEMTRTIFEDVLSWKKGGFSPIRVRGDPEKNPQSQTQGLDPRLRGPWALPAVRARGGEGSAQPAEAQGPVSCCVCRPRSRAAELVSWWGTVGAHQASRRQGPRSSWGPRLRKAPGRPAWLLSPRRTFWAALPRALPTPLSPLTF